jgi:hypothetical protein
VSSADILVPPADPRPAYDRRVWIKLAIVIVITGLMVALTLRHTERVNGPGYWMWSWRRLPALRLFGGMALAFLPFVVAHLLDARRWIRRPIALALVMLSNLAMQLAAIATQPPNDQQWGLRRLVLIVQNSINTSYYNAAEVLAKRMDAGATYRDWMEVYPGLMDVLMLHAAYKPPGLILYYIGLIRLFGGPGDAPALAGALIIAVLAMAGVAGTYYLIRYFGGSDDDAFCGASFFALTPSLVLFLPQFDQTYPALACALLITWGATLRPGGRRWAVVFGALFALMLFITPMFLMLGVFLAVYTLLHVFDRGGAGFARAAERSLIVVAVIVLLYVLLELATGFDMVTTFRTASARADAYIVYLSRPWPLHTPWDVYDIALGTGWISYPLAALGTLCAWRAGGRTWRNPLFRLVALGLLQIGMAVGVSIFPGENARLMLWAMPMLMIPIGIELARGFPPGARLTVYVCLWLITTVICQNMVFIYMGPELDGVHS